MHITLDVECDELDLNELFIIVIHHPNTAVQHFQHPCRPFGFGITTDECWQHSRVERCSSC